MRALEYVIFILCSLFASSVEAYRNAQGYYWMDVTGGKPSSALPGGINSAGRPIYQYPYYITYRYPSFVPKNTNIFTPFSLRQTRFAIRSADPNLVLDATQRQIKLQKFNGTPIQLWKLQPADYGRWFIVNVKTGRVLDVVGEVAVSGIPLITFPKLGSLNQQWYINFDKTIVSPNTNLAVDASKLLIEGSPMVLRTIHRQPHQLFTFEKL